VEMSRLVACPINVTVTQLQKRITIRYRRRVEENDEEEEFIRH
jgi:hypothetical protein